VGVYETYDGETIEIIEERGRQCSESSHRAGKVTVVAPGNSSSRDRVGA
jgi:hypothetical protein